MSVDMSDYVGVDERIATFREKYPDGSLQPADPDEPFRVVTIGDQTFIAYTAAAYRDQYDQRPGIATAWEPFPGKTNFTRDSELQNAETSAWGRAIVAALAADTRRGIASAEEVRNRNSNGTSRAPTPVTGDIATMPVGAVAQALRERGVTPKGTPDQLRAQLADLIAAGEAGDREASGGMPPSPVSTSPAADPDLAEAEALASAPCSLCGSTRTKRVQVGGAVRCRDATGCERRQAEQTGETCLVLECTEPGRADLDGFCPAHEQF